MRVTNRNLGAAFDPWGDFNGLHRRLLRLSLCHVLAQDIAGSAAVDGADGATLWRKGENLSNAQCRFHGFLARGILMAPRGASLWPQPG